MASGKAAHRSCLARGPTERCNGGSGSRPVELPHDRRHANIGGGVNTAATHGVGAPRRAAARLHVASVMTTSALTTHPARGPVITERQYGGAGDHAGVATPRRAGCPSPPAAGPSGGFISTNGPAVTATAHGFAVERRRRARRPASAPRACQTARTQLIGPRVVVVSSSITSNVLMLKEGSPFISLTISPSRKACMEA